MSFGAILPAEEAFKPIIGEIIKRLQKYLYYR
jgi:hypothetical protein